MEKSSAASPPVSVCERLFHAFQLHPTIRRLPFRQQDPVSPAPELAPVAVKPQSAVPQKQEKPAVLVPVQSLPQDKNPQQTTAQRPPSPTPPPKDIKPLPVVEKVQLTKVEAAASTKVPQTNPSAPPPAPSMKDVNAEARKSIEGVKTRRGVNQKVDEYINRTKNRMRSGSNVGRMTRE